MEDFLGQTIEPEQISRFAEEANNTSGKSVSDIELAKFQYAIALLRSSHNQDVRHGISILEKLFYEGENGVRRDYLYYISIGHSKLKQYNLALDCVNHFIELEPENRQAQHLRSYIKSKLIKDGVTGMVITGGAALLIGGLVGLGLAMTKK